jgi:hypothetical protein
MANNQTRVNAKQGGDLAIHSTTTDSPLLPIEQIERLQQLVPHRVEWVFDQTTKEADARRGENHRINTFVFLEFLIGQIFGFLIAVAGLGAAVYCAMLGQSVVAAVIGGTTVVGLTLAFITGKKPRAKTNN